MEVRGGADLHGLQAGDPTPELGAAPAGGSHPPPTAAGGPAPEQSVPEGLRPVGGGPRAGAGEEREEEEGAAETTCDGPTATPGAAEGR